MFHLTNLTIMKMLKISFVMLALGLMSFVPVSNSISSEFHADITWVKEEIDLGEIKQNVPRKIEFEFKNTGTEPVLITDVKASCGCTSTDYTKEPVKPGQKTTISATYNAAAMGTFRKTITVFTSADPNPKTLTFKGTVVI